MRGVFAAVARALLGRSFGALSQFQRRKKLFRRWCALETPVQTLCRALACQQIVPNQAGRVYQGLAMGALAAVGRIHARPDERGLRLRATERRPQRAFAGAMQQKAACANRPRSGPDWGEIKREAGQNVFPGQRSGVGKHLHIAAYAVNLCCFVARVEEPAQANAVI